jgi:hypothetical protein
VPRETASPPPFRLPGSGGAPWEFRSSTFARHPHPLHGEIKFSVGVPTWRIEPGRCFSPAACQMASPGLFVLCGWLSFGLSPSIRSQSNHIPLSRRVEPLSAPSSECRRRKCSRLQGKVRDATSTFGGTRLNPHAHVQSTHLVRDTLLRCFQNETELRWRG